MDRAYLLPISALDSGATPQSGFVFRVDQENMTVTRVPVSDVEIRGNMVAIGGDIEPGDLIVTAGVSFLRDGQAVRLWNAAQ